MKTIEDVNFSPNHQPNYNVKIIYLMYVLVVLLFAFSSQTCYRKLVTFKCSGFHLMTLSQIILENEAC